MVHFDYNQYTDDDSPLRTGTYLMVCNRAFRVYENDPGYRDFWLWSMQKRPAEELYDLEKDPDQLKNVANEPSYDNIRHELATRLMQWRRSTQDPVIETTEPFDSYPYYGAKPKN